MAVALMPKRRIKFTVHFRDPDFQHDLLHAAHLHRIDDFLRRIGFSDTHGARKIVGVRSGSGQA